MITGALIGDKAFVAKLRALPAAWRQDIDDTTKKLGFGLEAIVKSQYLTGQVFKVQTGRLRASISHGAPDSRSRFESTPTESSYYVGTNVEYAKPLFYGHEAYQIFPKAAKALHFTIGGKDIFAKHVNMPAKPGKNVLSMALVQYTPTILTQYELTLTRTAQRVLQS